MPNATDLAEMQKDIDASQYASSSEEHLEWAKRMLAKSQKRIERSDRLQDNLFDDMTYLILCTTQMIVHMRAAGIANLTADRSPVTELVEAQKMLYDVGVRISNAILYLDMHQGKCEKHNP